MSWQMITAAIGSAMVFGATATKAKADANYQKYQAAQLRADANAVVGAANVDAMKTRRAAAQQSASAVLQLASSGIDVDSQMAYEVERDIRERAHEDAYINIFNAARDAARMRAQAKEYKRNAKNTMLAGWINATTAAINTFNSSMGGGMGGMFGGGGGGMMGGGGGGGQNMAGGLNFGSGAGFAGG
jgi:hypothetical protein